MGKFKNNKSYSGKNYGHRDFGRPSFGAPRGDREMFETTCSQCGKRTTVPFRPNGKKPVFCNDCFRKNGPSDSDRPGFVKRNDYGRRSDFEKRSYSKPQNNEQIEALNRKLDRITEMLVTILVATKKEAPKKDEKSTATKKAKKLKNATPLEVPDAAQTA